ncbi:putative N-acetyltransferase domain-containing protein [Phytophthora infestans]|uniref:Putative N-acetyltransferase domain-containing protein n=1 Tax=Phytophthora infestans TaxID=4787 RepID=A0A8S9UZV9_PHYIN|nr:putative N-acetyltransferase domain-containing protein [Phytophthora infestans]
MSTVNAFGQAVGLSLDDWNPPPFPSHLTMKGDYFKTRAAIEAIFLLAVKAFQLGYRRLEWKCDSYNYPSRNAAIRFGFTYEGLFRQAIVYKGRDRSTTWFAIIDRDWNKGLKKAFERWLDSNNFDEEGQQKLRLSELTAPFVHARS